MAAYLATMGVYYLMTIAIETPILCVGLSSQHSLARRILSGIWLTACSYPIVWLVAPALFDPTEERVRYLLVAESVAHIGECLLFWLAFRPLQFFMRDMAVVFGANLASFGIGEAINQLSA
jgi:hypothetical protein